MDAVTAKQKAYVKKLFVRCGTPEWVFNPLKLWNISRQDADLLINGLRMVKDFDHGDLKDVIWQRIQGKNAIQKMTRTVDELEEEQAEYDPTCEDRLDQQTYDGILQKEWIHELHKDVLRGRGVQNVINHYCSMKKIFAICVEGLQWCQI